MTNIEVVIFDYINVISIISNNFFTALRELGLDTSVYGEAYYPNSRAWETQEIDNNTFWEKIKEHYTNTLGEESGSKFDSVDHIGLYEKIRKEYTDMNFLSWIQGIDQQKVLASNINPVSGENIKSELKDYFSQFFLSFELGISKPDENFYKIILNQEKVQPNNVCYVDDKLENIAAAQKLGIQGILFENKEQAIGDLSKLGVNPFYP